MKRELLTFSRRYKAALRDHLNQGPDASIDPARGLSNRALATGLPTLELAMLHERTLILELLPGFPAADHPTLLKQAGAFFAATIAPMGKLQADVSGTPAQIRLVIETLSQRTVQLSQEISQRKEVEKALKKSERHYAQLLKKSNHLQEQLRLLSRQVLSAQEDERKKISRELHDVIAQALTGINIRLAALKTEAIANTKGLQDQITSTQQLVEHSLDIVHRFARELRPAVLDDLGLIPALHTFLKHFKQETGIQVKLSAAAAVEQLSSDSRTVLFRVAQEALTNVARHAAASRVAVKIQQVDETITLTVKDNGKGLPAERVLHRKKQKRLGLLGMRERVEMVHGTFSIASTAGKGATILAQIPLADRRTRKAKP